MTSSIIMIIVIVGLFLGSLLTVIGIIRTKQQTRQFKQEADKLEEEFNKP